MKKIFEKYIDSYINNKTEMNFIHFDFCLTKKIKNYTINKSFFNNNRMLLLENEFIFV